MNKLASLYSKAEARDKMLKFAQFSARFIRTFTQNQLLLQRLNGLYSNVKTSRKIFRLGKSCCELHAIHRLLTTQAPQDWAVFLQVLVRVAFCLHWLFDNLSVLAACQVVQWEAKELNRVAMVAWFGAVVLSLLGVLVALARNYSEEALCLSQSFPSQDSPKIAKFRSVRPTLFLNLLKNICDFFPSASGSQLPQRYLGLSPGERLCGLGGSASALIALYQLYANSAGSDGK